MARRLRIVITVDMFHCVLTFEGHFVFRYKNNSYLYCCVMTRVRL